MRSLVMSIFLYACETWTIPADIERRMQALEMICFLKLHGISYRNHMTNEEVKTRIGNVSEKTQTEVVRARHTIIWTGQDYPTGNSTRRETKRQTEETMGIKHQRVDWL